jgi:hypothetical protein
MFLDFADVRVDNYTDLLWYLEQRLVSKDTIIIDIIHLVISTVTSPTRNMYEQYRKIKCFDIDSSTH